MTAERAYSHLKSRGLPSHIAKGMVGNIQIESSFDDDVISGRRLGDNGSAFGAFQHRGDRLQNLVSFANDNKLDPQKLETQLDFAIHEMTTGKDAGAKRALQQMMQTSDAGEAAQIFMQHFERPNADPNINHIAKRVQFATTFNPTSQGNANLTNLQQQPNNLQGSSSFADKLAEFRGQPSQKASIPQGNIQPNIQGQVQPQQQGSGSFADRLKAFRSNQQPALPQGDVAPQQTAQAPIQQESNQPDGSQELPPEIDVVLHNFIYGVNRLGKGGQGFGETLTPENQKIADLLQNVKNSRDDGDVQQQIKTAFPDAQFKQLEDGTTIAEFGGIQATLNKPGFSNIDLTRGVKDAAFIGLPSLVTGGAGGAVLGGIGRYLGAGLGAGAGSIANDLNAGANNGTVDIREGNAIIAAGTGIAGEAIGSLVARLAPAAIQGVKNLIGKGEFIRNGQPTQATVKILQEAGIPPEQITPELLTEFTKLSRSADDPIAAARAADAQALPEPMQLTTGQATQNPATLSLEAATKKGAFGESAASQGLAKQEAQQAGLEANANSIRNQVSGGQPITQRGQGAAAAQTELATSRESAKKVVSAKFEIAKQGKAGIKPQAVATFRNDLSKSLRADFDIDSLPVVSGLLKTLKTPPNATSVNLGALENFRKRVSGARRSAAKGTASTSATEAAALSRMLEQYDTAIQGSLSDAVVKGSADDILKWREAISSRREFANRFESVPIIQKLTQTTTQGGQRVLKVDAADAAAEIFGRGALGLKRGLGRDLAQLKKELSPQAFNSIKDEATLHLFAAADGTFKFGTEFAKRMDLLKRDGSPVLRALFTKQEIGLLDNLSRVAKTVERTPRIVGDTNPSGTAAVNAIIRKAGQMGGAVGEFITAFGTNFGSKAANRVQVAKVSDYYAGVLAKRTAKLPTAFKVGGVVIANDRIQGAFE